VARKYLRSEKRAIVFRRPMNAGSSKDVGAKEAA
jgi:hypothetical protein